MCKSTLTIDIMNCDNLIAYKCLKDMKYKLPKFKIPIILIKSSNVHHGVYETNDILKYKNMCNYFSYNGDITVYSNIIFPKNNNIQFEKLLSSYYYLDLGNASKIAIYVLRGIKLLIFGIFLKI